MNPSAGTPGARPSAGPATAASAPEWFASPAASTGSKVLVLGLGNDILTDDAVGLHIAQAVRHRFAGHAAVDVIDCCEMGLGLMDYIVGYRDLVVVDSVQTGRVPPGYLHEVGEDAIKSLPGMSPHFLGVGEILVLGRMLGLDMPRRVKVFAVEVEDPYTLGTKLSESVNRLLPQILDRITAAVFDWASVPPAQS